MTTLYLTDMVTVCCLCHDMSCVGCVVTFRMSGVTTLVDKPPVKDGVTSAPGCLTRAADITDIAVLFTNTGNITDIAELYTNTGDITDMAELYTNTGDITNMACFTPTPVTSQLGQLPKQQRQQEITTPEMMRTCDV